MALVEKIATKDLENKIVRFIQIELEKHKGFSEDTSSSREIRYIEMVERRFSEMREYSEKRFEAMDKRFEAVDKRFEAVDKRFEAVDKRFEEMREDMNRRFEEMREDMNRRFEEMREYSERRFEAVDKRFEEMREDMNNRFEMMNKRFVEFRIYLFGIGGLLAGLISYFELFYNK